MVVVDPAQDTRGRWCKAGKPIPAQTIRAGAVAVSPSRLEPMRDAKRSRTLRLREAGCPDLVFRVTITEWTYESSDAARAALARLKALDKRYDSEAKDLHEMWQEGPHVYYALGGAHMFTDRFRALIPLPEED
jgi:hypothetical protein